MTTAIRYGPAERRRPLISPWVWWVGAALGVGAMAWAWWPRSFGTVPVLEEKTSLTIPDPGWNGYAPMPKPEVKPVSFEPDPRVDAMRRHLEALQAEDAKLRERLQQLEQRPVAAATAEKPKPPPPHRHMGYLAFEQPKEEEEKAPLYALAPADTKLECIVESQMNSDVQSIAVVKITTNVYNTDTRRHLLIPQGSSILTRYESSEPPLWRPAIACL